MPELPVDAWTMTKGMWCVAASVLVIVIACVLAASVPVLRAARRSDRDAQND